MRSLVRLFAVALVGTITFGSMVKAAEAPVNPQNPSVSTLSEAYRASKKVLVLPVEVVPKGVPKDKTKRCPPMGKTFRRVRATSRDVLVCGLARKPVQPAGPQQNIEP